ncbi:uncharacterized protein K460DRAFT_208773 [Cucurbitaria berberidis CBS 394.84]|uniref:Uncharacterized protein n=1 Tax=Cucurbitaria berberidis CBS 394.84 TaxID=1168544 RepID=A0A9P4L3L6_9PLEO|nr:uncharacterized protein K460DRAFT_208773 [Cucurbitaria berberidis CBS 394.84]KAF1840454.1 hypothetical protein K460DRAFT_208773 [Cucurbitaria berberidis CBS 394.84]
MVLAKRYCVQYDSGQLRCYGEDGFWYTDVSSIRNRKGLIIKWIFLAVIFLLFMYFIGGYIHAKNRMRKGLPLLAYHRFLVSGSDRRRYGQGGVPQNHFTFYQTQQQQQPYHPNAPYQQRQDGAWAEPPPLYQNNDAPPQYFPPPGATKAHPNQAGGAGAMEMPQYGGGPQGGPQQSGVVGGSSTADVEQGQQTQQLPPRPQAAKAKILGLVERFRR